MKSKSKQQLEALLKVGTRMASLCTDLSITRRGSSMYILHQGDVDRMARLKWEWDEALALLELEKTRDKQRRSAAQKKKRRVQHN